MCMGKRKTVKSAWFIGLFGAAVASMLVIGGCEAVQDFTKTDKYRFFSPDKIIFPTQRSPINPILSSVSLVDQTQELVPNATFPTEGDWEYTDKDYLIGPTDVVDVTILDLFQEGVPYMTREEISASGFIALPLLPEKIKAEGLTKDELKEAIVQAYSPDILREPTVSVSIAAAKQNTYYILGAIARPSQYYIARKDMRLLEAIATAGGVTQMNIPYLYVIRPAPAVRKAAGTGIESTAPAAVPGELPTLPEELPGATQPSTIQGVNDKQPEPIPLVKPQEKPAAEQPAPVVAPAKTPPAPAGAAPVKPAGTKDIESALHELGQAMPATAPQVPDDNEPSPSPTVTIPQLTELVSGSSPATATGAAPGEAAAKPYKWIYKDGRWVRVAREVEPPTPPAEPSVPTIQLKIPAVVAEKPAAQTAPSAPAAPVVSPPPAVAAPRPLVQAKAPPPARQPEAPVAARPVAAETRPAAQAGQEDPFGWKKANKSDMARIIAIDLSKLNNGDPRMNIVLRDNDIIQIPYLPVGEFYVTGEVLRPGVYSLPGRPINIKQALSAAGNVGPLAWPENSILIRRIGNNQEQTIPLNVEAIFRGEEPDFFLKPDDVIAVGTDVRTTFYAVLRNAFRMTYGFGFIYDRNFADPLTVTPDNKRFTRW